MYCLKNIYLYLQISAGINFSLRKTQDRMQWLLVIQYRSDDFTVDEFNCYQSRVINFGSIKIFILRAGREASIMALYIISSWFAWERATRSYSVFKCCFWSNISWIGGIWYFEPMLIIQLRSNINNSRFVNNNCYYLSKWWFEIERYIRYCLQLILIFKLQIILSFFFKSVSVSDWLKIFFIIIDICTKVWSANKQFINCKIIIGIYREIFFQLDCYLFFVFIIFKFYILYRKMIILLLCLFYVNY